MATVLPNSSFDLFRCFVPIKDKENRCLQKKALIFEAHMLGNQSQNAEVRYSYKQNGIRIRIHFFRFFCSLIINDVILLLK